MDAWNTTFLLGRPIFRGELLVSGRVYHILLCNIMYTTSAAYISSFKGHALIFPSENHQHPGHEIHLKYETRTGVMSHGTHLGGIKQAANVWVNFEGFPLNSALFGLVIHHDPCN